MNYKKKVYIVIYKYLHLFLTMNVLNVDAARERNPARHDPLHDQVRQACRRVLRELPVRYQEDAQVHS